MLSFAAGWRSSRVGSIVTCSGPAPPHRPAPSPSLACSPAERRRRRDSGRRLRGRRERGRGLEADMQYDCLLFWQQTYEPRSTRQEVPLEFDVCVCFSEAKELAP